MTLTFCRRGLVVIFDFDWRRDFHLLGLGKLKRKAMILCKLDAVSGGRPFTLHHRHKMSLFHTHQHTQDQPPTNVQTRPWMRSTNLFTTHLAGHGVLREVPRAVEVLPARAAELARFVRRGGGAPGGGGARDVARGGRRLDARCVDDVLRGDGRAQLRVCEKHASNTNKNSDMWRRVVRSSVSARNTRQIQTRTVTCGDASCVASRGQLEVKQNFSALTKTMTGKLQVVSNVASNAASVFNL